MNPLREKIEYVLAKGLLTILRYCPASVIYGICRVLAELFYVVAIQRRQITLANLNLAFPELSSNEKSRLARAVYDHFGQFIAESAMILCGKINQADLMDMVDGSETEKLLALETSTEKGILFITGHLGNFELLAHYTGLRMRRSGYVVARKGTNKRIDDRIVTPLRKSFGNGVIYKSRALPLVARALKNGEHIGLLTDIKTNAREGVAVTFFGKKSLAIKSAAYLQIKLKAPVVPVAMVRIAPKRYKLIAGDPISWCDNGKPQDDQIAELTQLHQNALESMIRQYPAQWLWMHDRWKL